MHARYSAVIASGVSPYSTNEYFYKTSGIIPIQKCQYTGYYVVNAIIINLTSLNADTVVYVLNPFLFNLALIISIFIASKFFQFSPNQALVFLVLYNFVNDPNAIFTPAFATGEILGNALGIIGTAMFLQQKPANLRNIRSYIIVPIFLFASILHIANLAFIVILAMYTVVCTVLSLITKKKYSHNYKHLVFFGLTAILVIPFIIPTITPLELKWIIPYADVGDNVVDAFNNPPPIPPTENTSEVLEQVPFNATPMETTFLHIYDRGLEHWLKPETVPQFFVTLGYPFWYVYWGLPARATVARVLTFVGYNLTSTDIENLSSLHPTFSSIVPTTYSIIYNIGVPLIFVAVLIECFRRKEEDNTLLAISSYLLMTGMSLSFLLFSFAPFPSRFITYITFFWIIVLTKFNTGFMTKKYIFPFFIARSVLWITALAMTGGY